VCEDFMALFLQGPLETIRRLPANLARIFEDARLKRLAREADRMLDQEIAVMRRNGTRESYNGVFFLIFVNLAGFILSKLFGFAFVSRFALPHWRPAWYQFFTSLFLHSSWNHLSGNLFFLYIFGKLVEEEEGAFGLIASYLICGLGSNIISLLFCPGNIVSLGASGAVFGLFAVSVLLKMKFDLKKIIECLILGQFVFQQVMLEVQLSALGPLDGINHIAHVAGALVGVVLIQLVRKANRGTK